MPTYNEKDTIEDLVNSIRDVLKNVEIDCTMIIIDGNSPDGTGEIADKLSQKYNNSPFQLLVIHEKEKRGLAKAYISAFEVALKKDFDYILSMDADFSHKPEYIPDFLREIKKYDLVIGSRNIKGGGVENWSILRKIISRGGSLYSRLILGVKVYDFTGGYNMFRQKALSSIGLESIKSGGYSFQIEMKYRTIKRGFSYTEIPIIFPDRTKGKSKMSKKIFFEALKRVWQLRFSKL